METDRSRKDRILDIFQRMYRVSLSSLAVALGAPEASIRRNIQELRREGHNISFAMRGTYTYRSSTF